MATNWDKPHIYNLNLNLMKNNKTIRIIIAYLCLQMASIANAGLSVSIVEQNGDLLMSHSGGTLNTTDLTQGLDLDDIRANFGGNASTPNYLLTVGGAAGTTNDVTQFSGGGLTFNPTNWSPAGTTLFGTDLGYSATGDFVGYHYDEAPDPDLNFLLLPRSFTSGSSIVASSSTYANATLSELGLQQGSSFEISWGTLNADSITYTVVPEPHVVWLAGGLFILLLGYRKGGKVLAGN